MTRTYEAVHRIAAALYAEYQATGRAGYLTHAELATVLARFGHVPPPATPALARAAPRLTAAAFRHVARTLGRHEAHKIHWAVRDDDGRLPAAAGDAT